jgi:hypothetical protein
VRVLVLGLLFSFSCGSADKENSDGGSSGPGAHDAAPGERVGCMLDGDCAPGEACVGALPGVARSGRCQTRGDHGIAVECVTP